jgi:hypothetical protein
MLALDRALAATAHLQQSPPQAIWSQFFYWFQGRPVVLRRHSWLAASSRERLDLWDLLDRAEAPA